MNRLRVLLICIFLTLLLFNSFESTAQEGGNKVSESLANFFDPVYGVDQRLVSGPFYYGPITGEIDGHPFYIDEEWKIGSVIIDNLLFEDQLLKYDIDNNNIILGFTNPYGANLQIILRKSRVNSFTMNGRKFIPYPGLNEPSFGRFCEEVSKGPIDYLILQTKALKVSSAQGTRDYIYNKDIKQLLQIDNTIILFRSKRTIFKLYPQYKQEIKKFLKSNNIYPLKKRIEDRALMIKFCNSLIEKEN